ncbi:hypothetical protein PoB_006859700 [Plakobranchus ocellatus]|uniref:Uncharacterized protein n=1 Tax=Plakobranchus ocellatus TaxID=259542 RepID=A0AAV4DCX4_9GAST|nr:hypothetical protein PoB_006859700 [Plakobranchus ocellatus]
MLFKDSVSTFVRIASRQTEGWCIVGSTSNPQQAVCLQIPGQSDAHLALASATSPTLSECSDNLRPCGLACHVQQKTRVFREVRARARLPPARYGHQLDQPFQQADYIDNGHLSKVGLDDQVQGFVKLPHSCLCDDHFSREANLT